MPLFQIDIQLKQNTEYWTNRWIVQAADLQAVLPQTPSLSTFYAAIMTTNVTLDRYRIAPYPGPTQDNFLIYNLGYNGSYAGGAIGTQIPLFNCVRADLGVAVGRPSRKYLRVGLTEGMIEGSTILESYRTLVSDALAALIGSASNDICDVDGQGIVNGVVFPAVAMRQLRRGSKRKLQPII